MTSETTISNSESSVSYPNYKIFKIRPKQRNTHTPHDLPTKIPTVVHAKSVVSYISSKESTNFHYLPRFSRTRAMKSTLKGKSLHSNVVEGGGSGLESRNGSRSARWPEEHVKVLSELLMEEFESGYFSNGSLRRERLQHLVGALNRRLGTNYTEAVTLTRFKNMKADFRMLYNLSNRSGWGWDDQLHLPVATDEIWEEIYKECPRMRRFRYNPFTQYETFEIICGLNTATGSMARSYHSGESGKSNTMSDNIEQSEILSYNDEFLSMHGISYSSVDPETETPMNQDTEPSNTNNSKRSCGEKLPTRRKVKAPKKVDRLTEALTTNSEKVEAMTNTVNQHFPFTMAECIAKLKSIPNLSVQAIMAVQEEIMYNPDSRAILMLWEEEVLFLWIEQTTALHPIYCKNSVWR